MLPGDADYLAWQRADLLRFLVGSRHPMGFAYLDGRGGVDQTQPIALWISCRMTHVAALGALAQDCGLESAREGMPGQQDLRALAAHGVQCLLGPLHDAEHEGWYASVRHDGEPDVTAKEAYGHAFVLLAASSAKAAGIDAADDLLQQAITVFLDRFWDEAEGLSREAWNRDWTSLDDYRGINANMHTVEAFLAVGDVTGDASWHQRAARIARRVVSWARDNHWRIPEHFDADWQVQLEHNRDKPADPFRPYGATVGHGLEWARLLLALDQTLAAAAPTGLQEAATALYQRALEDGWQADGQAGFVYTTDWSGEPVVRARMHWVLAEAANTAHALWTVTQSTAYLEDYRRFWAYADRYFIDREYGSWQHELDEQNRPADSVWPGKPDIYHAYQAALLPTLPLTPSFAAALAAQLTYTRQNPGGS